MQQILLIQPVLILVPVDNLLVECLLVETKVVECLLVETKVADNLLVVVVLKLLT